MKVGNVESLPANPVHMEGAEKVQMRLAIGPEQSAPNFAMRVFDVAAGGHTPHHAHGFEHEVFVLAGRGSFVEEDREVALAPGDVVFVAPDVVHQFRADPEQDLRFICVVPNS